MTGSQLKEATFYNLLFQYILPTAYRSSSYYVYTFKNKLF